MKNSVREKIRNRIIEKNFSDFWGKTKAYSPILVAENDDKISKKNASHNLRLIILIFLLSLILLLLIYIIPFFILKMHEKITRKDYKNPKCFKMISRIATTVNVTTDPCEDFYQYACGKWIEDTFLSPSDTSKNQFNLISERNMQLLFDILSAFKKKTKAKLFFDQCMSKESNNDSLWWFRKFMIETSGPTPFFHEKKWSMLDYSLSRALATAHLHKVDIIFKLAVAPDIYNSTVQRVYLEKPSLFLLESHLRDSELFCGEILKYGESLLNVVLNEQETHLDSLKINEMLKDIVEFDREISYLTQRRPLIIGDQKIISYKELVTLFDSWMNGADYINRMLSPIFINDLGRYDKESIIKNLRFAVYEMDYFEALRILLSKSNVETVANYVAFMMLHELVDYMESNVRERKKSVIKALSGRTDQPPIWKSCTRLTDESFGLITGTLYIKRTGWLNDDRLKHITELVEYLKKTLVSGVLAKAAWMDKKTREKAIKKANRIVVLLAYPDQLNDKNYTDKFYDTLKISHKSWIINVLAVRKFIKVHNLQHVLQETKRDEWSMGASEVNAYFAPSRNAIVFPAGILQPPFYDEELPAAFNYGGIGTVIGHELTHAFDNHGRRFDYNGNFKEWWAPITLKKFRDKIHCFVEQYNRLRGVNDIKINGYKTLAENIADNGGLSLAYETFLRYLAQHGEKLDDIHLAYPFNFTNNQLFFLSFAGIWCSKSRAENEIRSILTDPHAPPKIRVIGTLSNSAQFNAAFKCKKNDRMNSKVKCKAW